MRAINIAITVNLTTDSQQSIFYNGANQHCVFLYMLLKSLPFVNNVWLAGNVYGNEISTHMFMAEFAEDIVPLNTVIFDTDLLIEMNSFIGRDHADVVRRRGGKVIAYKFGNELFMSLETMLFSAHGTWIPHPTLVQFDQIWTTPQHARSCGSFFGNLLRARVEILPHLWHPHFIEEKRKLDKVFSSNWGYKPSNRPGRKVGIFEPNLNVIKTSLIPMMASNAAYLQRREAIEHVYVTNALQLLDNRTFKHIALQLEVCRDHVATIEPRHVFVDFMASGCDIVVSHQFENELNYLYFECLYGGYPLVHNSAMLHQAGYQYAHFDIDDCARVLLKAIDDHDRALGDYQLVAATILESVDPTAGPVKKLYADAVRKVFAWK